jgi:hypothetical protein
MPCLPKAFSGFVECFVHLRTGAVPEDPVALMTAVLADATNLGLARMARSSGVFSHTRLLWTAEWHLRDETYQAALACLVDAIHAQPFSPSGARAILPRPMGRSSGPATRRSQRPLRVGARHKILHPRLRPLCAVLHQGHCGKQLPRHPRALYRYRRGDEHVFGLCRLLGFRFAPRGRDLADRRLYVADDHADYDSLDSLIGDVIYLSKIEENWDEILRMTASIRLDGRTVGASAPASRLYSLDDSRVCSERRPGFRVQRKRGGTPSSITSKITSPPCVVMRCDSS